MATLVVGQATGLDANGVVARHVQRLMTERGVSVEALAVALGASYVGALCKLACCGEWTMDDVRRASLMFGIDGALLLS